MPIDKALRNQKTYVFTPNCGVSVHNVDLTNDVITSFDTVLSTAERCVFDWSDDPGGSRRGEPQRLTYDSWRSSVSKKDYRHVNSDLVGNAVCSNLGIEQIDPQ
jgi:hypothetical protein